MSNGSASLGSDKHVRVTSRENQIKVLRVREMPRAFGIPQHKYYGWREGVLVGHVALY